jgi:hypothetical protein
MAEGRSVRRADITDEALSLRIDDLKSIAIERQIRSIPMSAAQ